MLGRIYGHSCADASSFQRHLPHPMTLARRKEKDACKRTCVLRCRAQARACTGGRAPGASVQTHAHGQARATMQALTPSLAMKHEPVRTHTSRCIYKREHCDNSRKHTCIEMCMQYHANALDTFTCTGRVCGLPRAGVCASSRGACNLTCENMRAHLGIYLRAPSDIPSSTNRAVRSSSGNMHRSGQQKPRVVDNDVLDACNSKTFTVVILLHEAQFLGYRDDAEETTPSIIVHSCVSSFIGGRALVSLLCLSLMLRKWTS